jgi:predicted nucleic acid-binding protein
MRDNIFIDTNIFVYAYTDDDRQRHESSRDLLKDNVLANKIVLSVQILNEFYSVMTKYKYSHDEIKSCLDEIIEQAEIMPLKLYTFKSCLFIKEKYGYSLWDSLVLASALENNCKIVYSEDMQHGQLIENNLKIVNPFHRRIENSNI